MQNDERLKIQKKRSESPATEGLRRARFGVSFLGSGWQLGPWRYWQVISCLGRESGDIAEIEAAIRNGQDLEQENEGG